MALSGVENKFPNGLETKMDVSKDMIKLQAKNKELEDNISNAVLFVNELKAENERLNALVGDEEGGGVNALATFGEFMEMTLDELAQEAKDRGHDFKKTPSKAELLKILYDDLMK